MTETKEKLVWVENIPSPYNLDLFEQLQKTFAAYECHFVYTNASEDNREWSLGDHQIDHVHVLKSHVLKLTLCQNLLRTTYLFLH